MAPKWSDTMADMVITKCVPNQVAKCLIPFLVFFQFSLVHAYYRFMNEK